MKPRLWLYIASIRSRGWLAAAHRRSFRLFIAPAGLLRKAAQAGLGERGLSNLDCKAAQYGAQYAQLQVLYDRSHRDAEYAPPPGTFEVPCAAECGLSSDFDGYYIKETVLGAHNAR